jgi:hypothetical protein
LALATGRGDELDARLVSFHVTRFCSGNTVGGRVGTLLEDGAELVELLSDDRQRDRLVGQRILGNSDGSLV